MPSRSSGDPELLLEFRRFGLPLPHHWTTITNGAAFGTDYFTRTAVAKSNILVNKSEETKYFYQDLDAPGDRLNAAKRYTVTFAEGQLPPVRGFWSLTLYNQHHFFAPNQINRFSVGTKNKDLMSNADGSLTIYVQADAPRDPIQQANWLPAPKVRTSPSSSGPTGQSPRLPMVSGSHRQSPRRGSKHRR